MKRLLEKLIEAIRKLIAGTEPAKPAPAPMQDHIDLAAVRWLHRNVSDWKKTATLRVAIGGGTVRLDYDKARTWPGRTDAGTAATVNANPWIFIPQGDTWLAVTWEWLRPGQTSKPTSVVNAKHIKHAALADFAPKAGTVYGWMVSGLARGPTNNVPERTPIILAPWTP